jgi:hypothetical protein
MGNVGTAKKGKSANISRIQSKYSTAAKNTPQNQSMIQVDLSAVEDFESMLETSQMVSHLKAENESSAFQLGEQDVELDRLRTTIQALNHKIAVTDSLREQLDEQREYLQKSEDEKTELQNQLNLTVIKTED